MTNYVSVKHQVPIRNKQTTWKAGWPYSTLPFRSSCHSISIKSFHFLGPGMHGSKCWITWHSAKHHNSKRISSPRYGMYSVYIYIYICVCVCISGFRPIPKWSITGVEWVYTPCLAIFWVNNDQPSDFGASYFQTNLSLLVNPQSEKVWKPQGSGNFCHVILGSVPGRKILKYIRVY